jgi:hypothetical protein
MLYASSTKEHVNSGPESCCLHSLGLSTRLIYAEHTHVNSATELFVGGAS